MNPRTFSLTPFFGLILALGTVSAQQLQDVVYLNNGWALRGSLMQTDSSIWITTADGSIFRFDESEVRRIAQEPYPDGRPVRVRPPFDYPEPGFTGFLKLGILSGSTFDNNVMTPVATPELQMGYGYRMNHWLSAGVGTGISFYEQGFLMPLFLDVRGDLFPSQVTLHYFGQAGYNIPLFADPDWVDQFGNEREANSTGGLMYEAGLGVKIFAHNRVACLVGISYRAQNATFAFVDWGGNLNMDEMRFRRVGIHVGLML